MRDSRPRSSGVGCEQHRKGRAPGRTRAGPGGCRTPASPGGERARAGTPHFERGRVKAQRTVRLTTPAHHVPGRFMTRSSARSAFSRVVNTAITLVSVVSFQPSSTYTTLPIDFPRRHDGSWRGLVPPALSPTTSPWTDRILLDRSMAQCAAKSKHGRRSKYLPVQLEEWFEAALASSPRRSYRAVVWTFA